VRVNAQVISAYLSQNISVVSWPVTSLALKQVPTWIVSLTSATQGVPTLRETRMR